MPTCCVHYQRPDTRHEGDTRALDMNTCMPYASSIFALHAVTSIFMSQCVQLASMLKCLSTVGMDRSRPGQGQTERTTYRPQFRRPASRGQRSAGAAASGAGAHLVMLPACLVRRPSSARKVINSSSTFESDSTVAELQGGKTPAVLPTVSIPASIDLAGQWLLFRPGRQARLFRATLASWAAA